MNTHVDQTPLTTEPVTTAAQFKDFKERLAQAVKDDLNETQTKSPWMFENTETIDLSNSDTEVVEKLVFGDPFEQHEKWENNSHDTHADQDEEAVKDCIETLLSKQFRKEFEQLCLAMDIDEDEMQDDLVNDDEFSPSTLDLNLHHIDFDYRGVAAAYASCGEFNLDPFKPADLFGTLRLFRIDLQDYLDAATTILDDKYSDGEMSKLDTKVWGLEHIDLNEPSNMEHTWSQIYCDEVRQAYKAYQNRTDLCVGGYTAAPAVDASELITMAMDVHGCSEIYAHISVGSDAITQFNFPIRRHDFPDVKNMGVQIRSGYISCSTSPGSGAGFSADIAGFIEVPYSRFSVVKDTPESSNEDDFKPSEPHCTYINLYERCYIKRKHAPYAEPLHLDNADDQACLSECLSIMRSAPWWATKLAIDKLALLRIPQFLEPLAALRQDAKSQTQLDEQLIANLESLNPLDFTSNKTTITNIEQLLGLGACAQACNGAGVSAFDLACRAVLPLETIKAMAPLQCDSDTGDVNAITRTLQTIDLLAQNPSRNGEFQTQATDLAIWLLNQGYSLPPAHHLPSHPIDNSPFAHAANSQHGALFAGLLSDVERRCDKDNYTQLLAVLLNHATERLNTAILPTLLDCGADPMSAKINDMLAKQTAMCAGSSYRQEKTLPRIIAFKDIIRAHQTRQAALQAIEEFNASPAP